MIQDRPLVGISLMIGFCAIAPLGDSMAKILGDTIPLVQLLFARFAVQAVLMLPVVFGAGISLAMTPRLYRITFVRTLLHMVGIGSMFTALRYLPLADAIAICFVMPFILLALGAVFLGEEVGPRRIGACTVGFVGTLLVVQPSFAAVGWPALLPLVVAVVFALYMLISRQIAKECDPLALQTVSGMIGTPILGAILLLTLDSEGSVFGVVVPDAREWALIAAIGVLGTIGHLLMTWSLRFAPSATVAPVQYLEIPFATVIGWFVFADLPTGLAALGIAITVVAGLYILFRERRLARPRPSEA